MMKLRSLWIVTAMAALVAVFAAAASADTGPTDIGKALALSIAPAQGTLAPGQSAWYSFVVPQEYSVVQMKRDERNGVNITPQTLTLQFSNSSNPDTAHNTGFHVYDPQGAHWVMNGIIPPSTLNAEGKPVAQPAWFGEGSPTPSGSLPDGADVFLGAPKEWQGVLNDAGTYYVEVFNQSGEPMSYNLAITGPNLSLAAAQPSSVQSAAAASAASQGNVASGSQTAPAMTAPMMSGPGNGSIGQATPLTAAPVNVSLAPGQSAWFSFVVPQEYSVEQMKRDERRGVDIAQQSILFTFDNAGNPDVAHNTGFYLYDPQRAAWLMNGVEPPTRRDESGIVMRDESGNRQFENAFTASGSPDVSNANTKNDSGIDYFLGVPKLWAGVLNSAGTYYVQVFNNSQEPLNGTLTISGPNLSLGAQ
ncbi:MAG: hypothetical protein U0641_18500 [Anaerolineae bacterium]